MEKKTFVTSFNFDYIKKFKEYAPEFRVGYLALEVSDELIEKLRLAGVDELCPKASQIDKELVFKWHRAGFNVRAWGVDSPETMKKTYDSGINGMTVNFPDLLANYIAQTQNNK